MRFGQMSVTEAQLAIIALHIATAVLGSDIWTTVVFRSVTLGQVLQLSYLYLFSHMSSSADMSCFGIQNIPSIRIDSRMGFR